MGHYMIKKPLNSEKQVWKYWDYWQILCNGNSIDFFVTVCTEALSRFWTHTFCVFHQELQWRAARGPSAAQHGRADPRSAAAGSVDGQLHRAAALHPARSPSAAALEAGPWGGWCGDSMAFNFIIIWWRGFKMCLCVLSGLLDSEISSTRTACEEAMTVLEEVIMFTFQQSVYYLTKVCFHTLIYYFTLLSCLQGNPINLLYYLPYTYNTTTLDTVLGIEYLCFLTLQVDLDPCMFHFLLTCEIGV